MSRQKLIHAEAHPDMTLGSAGLKAYDYLLGHGRNIAIGGGVLVALVVGFVLMESSQQSSNKAAANLLAIALVDVTTNQTDTAAQKLTELVGRYGGSASGNRARLYLGDIELKRGNAAAALVQYDAFLGKTSSGDFIWTVGQRGKAIALENQSKFAEAAAAFEALASGNMGMEEKAHAMLDAAQARTRASDKNAAMALYERILKEYPYSRSMAPAKLGKAELSSAG